MDDLYFQKAVNQNGFALEYVPQAMRTPDLCLQAVNQNGWALLYVPETIKTPQLCLQAINQNGLALKYVPETVRTLDECKCAVHSNPKILKSVVDSLDLNICAVLEIEDVEKLDELMESERRKKASRFLDEEHTKGVQKRE